MKLTKGLKNKPYMVFAIDLPIHRERRLEALGLTKGTMITVLQKKRYGAVVVKFRGARFAFGADIARNIRVREEWQ